MPELLEIAQKVVWLSLDKLARLGDEAIEGAWEDE